MLTFKEIVDHSFRVKIGNDSLNNVLNITRSVLNKLDFVENYEAFYPKGIFLDKELTAYFFTEKGFHSITFNKDLTSITTIKYKQIQKVDLNIFGYEDYGLTIKLKDGEEIIFRAREDTNQYRFNDLNESIIQIYELLMEISA